MPRGPKYPAIKLNRSEKQINNYSQAKLLLRVQWWRTPKVALTKTKSNNEPAPKTKTPGESSSPKYLISVVHSNSDTRRQPTPYGSSKAQSDPIIHPTGSNPFFYHSTPQHPQPSTPTNPGTNGKTGKGRELGPF